MKILCGAVRFPLKACALHQMVFNIMDFGLDPEGVQNGTQCWLRISSYFIPLRRAWCDGISWLRRSQQRDGIESVGLRKPTERWDWISWFEEANREMGLNQLVRGSQQCKWFPTAFLHLSRVRLASARPRYGSWVLRPAFRRFFVIPQGKPLISHSNGIGRILLTPGGTLVVLCPLPRIKNTYIDKTPEEQKLPARILPTYILASWK